MEVLSEYLTYIDRGKAILFIGSGISSIAGCLGWDKLCNNLIQIKSIAAELKEQSLENITPQDIITFCRNSVSSDEEKKKIEGIFRSATTPDPDLFRDNYLPLIRTLKLIKPFPPILTTNVDSCLSDSREFEMEKIYFRIEEMKNETLKNGGIFHIHGYKEHASRQVWDTHDYSERYSQTAFREFLVNIFLNYSVLFLGYAFRDGELKGCIGDAAKRAGGNSNLYHYALIPTIDTDYRYLSVPIMEKNYKVKLIEYGNHDELVPKIKKWVQENFGIIKERGTPSITEVT